MKRILPVAGDERIVRRFFLIPTIVGRTEYWLESRWVREAYHWCVYCAGWEPVEVLEK